MLAANCIPRGETLAFVAEPRAPDKLIRSEQPEVAESLLNRRDLVWWTGILLGCVSWRGEAKLFFAVPNPGALGHKAVLPHNPFLDFLVRGAWTKRFMLAGRTRAPMSPFLVSTLHAGFRMVSALTRCMWPASL